MRTISIPGLSYKATELRWSVGCSFGGDHKNRGVVSHDMRCDMIIIPRYSEVIAVKYHSPSKAMVTYPCERKILDWLTTYCLISLWIFLVTLRCPKLETSKYTIAVTRFWSLFTAYCLRAWRDLYRDTPVVTWSGAFVFRPSYCDTGHFVYLVISTDPWHFQICLYFFEHR